MSSQKMSNKQLVLRIKAGENVADNMLQLWQQNQGFIRSIAKKYAAYEEIEDLIQQGYFGMCNAVNGYDPENGVSFLHYASFWIRQSIHGYIEDCGKIVRLPRHFRGKLTKYKQFTAAMYAELMLNGELLPAKKPDIDNIVKAVLDALNEVAYRDDTQVVELQVRKQYSERPRLEICNERLEEFLSFEKGKDQEGRSKEYFAYQMFAGH